MKTILLESPEEFVAVDLDRTLARFEWTADYSPLTIGDPIHTRIVQVRGWLKRGIPVKLFTARVASNHPDPSGRDQVQKNIRHWMRCYLGEELPIVSEKQFGCKALVDDIAVAVDPNQETPIPLTIKCV